MNAMVDYAVELGARVGDTPDYRAWRRDVVAEATLMALQNLAQSDAGAVMEAACGFLDMAGAGSPALASFSEDLRADAAFWADIASPVELEAHVGAGLRRMGVTAFAPEARKRILVLIWQSLPEADKRAFLSRVDPKGVFRARGK